MKAAAADDLETELHRLRQENADLRKRLNEASGLETAKKKAESKAEQLEQKVGEECHIYISYRLMPENKLEDVVQERIGLRENELNAIFDEKIRNYEQRYASRHSFYCPNRLNAPINSVNKTSRDKFRLSEIN